MNGFEFNKYFGETDISVFGNIIFCKVTSTFIFVLLRVFPKIFCILCFWQKKVLVGWISAPKLKHSTCNRCKNECAFPYISTKNTNLLQKCNGLGVPKNFALWEGGKIEIFMRKHTSTCIITVQHKLALAGKIEKLC
mgnify:CR=1 FL=1